MGLGGLFSTPNSYPFFRLLMRLLFFPQSWSRWEKRNKKERKNKIKKENNWWAEEEALGDNLVRESAESGKHTAYVLQEAEWSCSFKETAEYCWSACIASLCFGRNSAQTVSQWNRVVIRFKHKSRNIKKKKRKKKVRNINHNSTSDIYFWACWCSFSDKYISFAYECIVT